MAIRFSKMHGAGNDFVLVDLRGGQPRPDAAIARAIGNRHTGVGFDQLLTIEASELPACVARYRIWNSDGSQAQQCGNGARCVAAWLVRDGAASPPGFKMESPAGVIEVECLADGRFALDMGLPEFTPSAIPFNVAAERVQYEVVLDGKPTRFGAVSMGNPHAVIVVDAVAQAPVALIGPMLQSAGDFPESVNVGFAQIVSPAEINLRVFERGAGETLACGSGACAAVAVLVRQGRVGRHVDVHLPGGTLVIDWLADTAPVRMAGPATFVFEGEWLA
ncbi:MAG: diaminopimelate epimerase [Arenimonas sp.]|nr:diaminopimelate epimerase [Arenimonas sp.]